MGTLKEDIKTSAEWIIENFHRDGLILDYSLESFKVIDSFFDRNAKDGLPVPGGRLSKNMGTVMFSIGSYIGETIIKIVPGSEWETDDEKNDEIGVEVKLPDGAKIWPMQRVMKRFKNGAEDGIYSYGMVVTAELIKRDYWKSAGEKHVVKNKRLWWKFW